MTIVDDLRAEWSGICDDNVVFEKAMSALALSVAREAALLEALKAASEMEQMLSGAVSAASCETQDCQSEPWEQLVHGYWFDGKIASYRQQMDEALTSASAQAAEMLKNQRTPGTYEKCSMAGCGTEQKY